MRIAALALLAALPAAAQEDVSDDLIAYRARNALPLAEFVARDLGMARPEDATSPQNCVWQWNSVSIARADTTICARIIAKRRAMDAE